MESLLTTIEEDNVEYRRFSERLVFPLQNLIRIRDQNRYTPYSTVVTIIPEILTNAVTDVNFGLQNRTLPTFERMIWTPELLAPPLTYDQMALRREKESETP